MVEATSTSSPLAVGGTDLKARGHVVTVSRGPVGWVALIGIDPKTKQATAVGPAATKLE